MTDLVRRAIHRQPLSPAERALLKFLWTLVYGALSTAILALTSALAAGVPLSRTLLVGAAFSALTAILSGLAKFFSALHDDAFAQAASQLASVVKSHAEERGVSPDLLSSPRLGSVLEHSAEEAAVAASSLVDEELRALFESGAEIR